MSLRVLVNGREGSGIDPHDRGLSYGDGLFETMAVVAGTVPRLQAHMERLRRGCERLGIALPPPEELDAEIQSLVRDCELAVLKLIVTRGPGGRGYRPPADIRPTRVLYLENWPDYPREWAEEGVTVRLCRTRLAEQPLLAGLKHLNRLEQVLARSEWDASDSCAEGLMCDANGAVVCGTMSNVFVVSAGRLLTPRVDRCGVAGTMRAAVLELAGECGLEAVQTTLSLPALLEGEEIFLTNALIGLWPVRRFQEREYEAGPVTRMLQRRLAIAPAGAPIGS